MSLERLRNLFPRARTAARMAILSFSAMYLRGRTDNSLRGVNPWHKNSGIDQVVSVYPKAVPSKSRELRLKTNKDDHRHGMSYLVLEMRYKTSILRTF